MSKNLSHITTLLAENALTEALDFTVKALKSEPNDKALRHIYIDLLVLSGAYAKADAQCDLAARFEPDNAMGFALLRGEIRAMAARADWFAKGALPGFANSSINSPGPLDQSAIKLALALREGNLAEAAAFSQQIEQERSPNAFTMNGRACSDMRDLDDRLPHALEILTNGGAYLWVDMGQIAHLTLHPMARPRDLAFRRADLTLKSGTISSVLLPAIYPAIDLDSGAHADLALGRKSEWQTLAPGLTLGCGQRCLFDGEDMVSLHELEHIAALASPTERQAAHG